MICKERENDTFPFPWSQKSRLDFWRPYQCPAFSAFSMWSRTRTTAEASSDDPLQPWCYNKIKDTFFPREHPRGGPSKVLDRVPGLLASHGLDTQSLMRQVGEDPQVPDPAVLILYISQPFSCLRTAHFVCQTPLSLITISLISVISSRAKRIPARPKPLLRSLPAGFVLVCGYPQFSITEGSFQLLAAT